MAAIIKKELKTYFSNIPGYIFLFFFVILTAVFYFSNNVLGLSGDYHVTIISTTIIFLVMIPMLTMRLFAEEYSQKTDQLLYTSPLPISSIVFGKFFAALILLVAALGITVAFPLMLSRYGQLPVNRIAGTYIGYLLLGACYISIGILISVLTNNQIVAAVGTFAAVFAFYVTDSFISSLPVSRTSSVAFVLIIAAFLAYVLYDSTKSAVTAGVFFIGLAIGAAALYYLSPNSFDGLIVKVLKQISLMSRFSSYAMGVLSLSDTVYYLSFAFAFNYFTISVIEKRRWT